MQITATMVKELRDRTGAGMMECKKALTESSGDKDVAIEKMRKSGQAKADKKAGRIAAEGTIAISTSENAQQAAIVEVNCETDFVAKDEQFQAFSKQLSLLVIDNDVRSVDELNALESSSGQSVEQVRLELVNKIGENIQIRRFQKISSAFLKEIPRVFPALKELSLMASFKADELISVIKSYKNDLELILF